MIEFKEHCPLQLQSIFLWSRLWKIHLTLLLTICDRLGKLLSLLCSSLCLGIQRSHVVRSDSNEWLIWLQNRCVMMPGAKSVTRDNQALCQSRIEHRITKLTLTRIILPYKETLIDIRVSKTIRYLFKIHSLYFSFRQ